MEKIGIDKKELKQVFLCYLVCVCIGIVFSLFLFLGIFTSTVLGWVMCMVAVCISFFKTWKKNTNHSIMPFGESLFMYLVGWVGCMAVDIFLVSQSFSILTKYIYIYRILFFILSAVANILWYFIQKLYPEVAKYLVAGVATSVISFVSYIILSKTLGLTVFLSQLFSWVIAVIFAFFVNKIWVFTSKADSFKAIILEFLNFTSGRLATLVAFELGFFMLLVSLFKMDDIVAKLLVTVLVVLANYIWGKWITFKKPKKE